MVWRVDLLSSVTVPECPSVVLFQAATVPTMNLLLDGAGDGFPILCGQRCLLAPELGESLSLRRACKQH
jgi:hypothetical protein